MKSPLMFLAAGILLVSACASGRNDMSTSPEKWRSLDGEPPIVIAHRGASGYLPEHTLEAYALAIDQGADVIEPDLVFTKDGVLVARHDRYLSTTTDVADRAEFRSRKRADDDPTGAPREDWWVEDFTLAEIKTLRARQPFPGRPKQHDGLYKIPTFAEVLALAAHKAKEAGRTVGVYPETKHPAFFHSIGKDFERPLLDAIAGFDAGPVYIQSFEPDILKRLKGKTMAKLVQLVADEGGAQNIPLSEIATYADGVGAQKTLFMNHQGRRSEICENAHRLGMFTHLWTLRDDVPNEGVLYALRMENTPTFEDPLAAPGAAELRALLPYCDGVFADFPDSAVRERSYLETRNVIE